MNPLTNVKNITKLNEIELAKGTKKSWHDIYKDSAWIFIGGLAYGMTEGDILAVFSQYGEIVNINLVRDKKTGKIKGFCFLCYANQKSTILAVDNLNGIKLCNRTIRVDHVANYKPPKEDELDDELTKMLKSEGCAPKPLQADQNRSTTDLKHQKKKKKKEKKEKKEKKKKRKKHSEEKESESETLPRKKVKVKEEKQDPGYDKYDISHKQRGLERRQSQERSHERHLGEGSSFQRKHRSEMDKEHLKYVEKNSLKDNTRYRSNSSETQFGNKRDLRKDAWHRSYSPKEHKKNNANINKSVMRRSSVNEESDEIESSQFNDQQRSNRNRSINKTNPERSRSRSSSSSRSSFSSDDTLVSKEEIDKSQSKRSRKDVFNDSSSDNDVYKMSKKERYKKYDEKSYSQQSNRDKHDYVRDDFGSRSSKNDDRRNSHSELSSVHKYQYKERTDRYSRDSNRNKSKYERK